MGEPASPAEAAALDAFRKLLPDDGITTAWVNLTFINDHGRTAEVDVLLLTTQGMYLVELKGWHGVIRGNSQRWDQGQRNVENPRLAADRKAKWLKGLLQDRAPNQAARALVPRIHAVVVMHGEGSTVEIAHPGDIGVLTLDGYHVKSSPHLRKRADVLAQPPQDFRQPIDYQRAKQARSLCDAVGFTPTPKVRMVGDFVVADDEPIAQGRDWQDVLVNLPALPDVKRRLRLYDVPATASPADRQHIEQLAQREFQLTQGLRHGGIAVPIDFKRAETARHRCSSMMLENSRSTPTSRVRGPSWISTSASHSCSGHRQIDQQPCDGVAVTPVAAAVRAAWIPGHRGAEDRRLVLVDGGVGDRHPRLDGAHDRVGHNRRRAGSSLRHWVTSVVWRSSVSNPHRHPPRPRLTETARPPGAAIR